jgi:hypothetical protein
MRIERTYRYEGNVDRVLAIVTDASLYDEAAVRSRALSHDVTIEQQPAGVRIVLRRSLPTDQVPSFAQSFVGDSVDVVETTTWGAVEDGRVNGDFDVVIDRTPVGFRGSMSLVPPGGVAGMPGTEQSIAGDLKAGVPLLGRKIEESIAPLIVHQLDVLAEIVGSRLAQSD